jgi:tetratricopeptide (TPR) repeat protein
LGGFLDAAAAELKRGDLARAKKYYEWSVYCRGDAAEGYEGLGDYYAAVHQIPAAVQNYQLAIARDSQRAAPRDKLAQLQKISP